MGKCGFRIAELFLSGKGNPPPVASQHPSRLLSLFPLHRLFENSIRKLEAAQGEIVFALYKIHGRKMIQRVGHIEVIGTAYCFADGEREFEEVLGEVVLALDTGEEGKVVQ